MHIPNLLSYCIPRVKEDSPIFWPVVRNCTFAKVSSRVGTFEGRRPLKVPSKGAFKTPYIEICYAYSRGGAGGPSPKVRAFCNSGWPDMWQSLPMDCLPILNKLHI